MTCVIDVELKIRNGFDGTFSLEKVKDQVEVFLRSQRMIFSTTLFRCNIPRELRFCVDFIRIVCCREDDVFLFSEIDSFNIHPFQLSDEEPEDIVLCSDDEKEESVSACRHYIVPHVEFDGVWESLLFDDDVKNELVLYVESCFDLICAGVSRRLITWNNLCLLYGPPGTGKTSLLKGLAQILSIRLSGRFRYGHFVEIHAHSLFSKWFSESGKLVQKLFQSLHELIAEKDTIIFVLIDEVESLAVSRAQSVAGGEPSDALRGVNAFITQIDGLRRHDNVLLLTSSNLESAVDLAFLSRVDMKFHIGPPNPRVRYQILWGCLQEFIRVGIIIQNNNNNNLLLPSSYNESQIILKQEKEQEIVKVFLDCVWLCEGWTGRTLRKIPLWTQIHRKKRPSSSSSCSLLQFCTDMKHTIKRKKKDK